MVAARNSIGIRMQGYSAPGNTIGGTVASQRNVISGNSDGILVVGLGAGNNVIQGNYVGTGATGTSDVGNQQGVELRNGPSNVIAGNVVSGNDGGGISLAGPSNVVQNNKVGTDVSGTAPLGNGSVGILVGGVTTGNLIGGQVGSGGNIISANGTGLVVGSDGNTVQGNFVGTDVTGTVDLGNETRGIDVHGADNLIGGQGEEVRNVLSGNGEFGIYLIGDGSDRNEVYGNYIGTDATGAEPLGNTRSGVVIQDGDDNAIGGAESGANVIAFNGTHPDGGAGINVVSGTGNDIAGGNSIHSNARLGIDLGRPLFGPDGVTPNDPGDGDTGANELQNFPVLSSAGESGGGVDVSGSLDSKPGTDYRLDFYENDSCDPSGHGEGERFLQVIFVTTDASGHVSFSEHLAGYTGGSLTATATDPDGNTSEFSNCLALSNACADGVDNDGDGKTDFPRDKGCRSASDPSELTDCEDGIDNEGDGKVDHPADPGCSSPNDKTETSQCEDGIDNDGDDDVDFPADPGCSSARDNKEQSQCDDGRDNDVDGATDYPDDTGCTSPGDDKEQSQCQDGRDNDGDDKIDFPDDPGCTSPADGNEVNPQCSDEVDNDGDGKTDFSHDAGCTSARDNNEVNPQCVDGIDNDGDGDIDHPDDPGCKSANDPSENSEGVP